MMRACNFVGAKRLVFHKLTLESDTDTITELLAVRRLTSAISFMVLLANGK